MRYLRTVLDQAVTECAGDVVTPGFCRVCVRLAFLILLDVAG